MILRRALVATAAAATALTPLAAATASAGGAWNLTPQAAAVPFGVPDNGPYQCYRTSLLDWGNAAWLETMNTYPASQGRQGELRAADTTLAPSTAAVFQVCRSAATGKWYFQSYMGGYVRWVSDRINMGSIYTDMAAAEATVPEAWEQVIPVCLPPSAGIYPTYGFRSPVNAGRYLTVNFAGSDSNAGMMSYSAGSPTAFAQLVSTNDFMHCAPKLPIIAAPVHAGMARG